MDLNEYMTAIITAIEDRGDKPGKVSVVRQTTHPYDRLGLVQTEFTVNPFSNQPDSLSLVVKREVGRNMLGPKRIGKLFELIGKSQYVELEGIKAEEPYEESDFSTIMISPSKYLHKIAWVSGDDTVKKILLAGGAFIRETKGEKLLFGKKYFQNPHDIIKYAIKNDYSITYVQGNREEECSISIFKGKNNVTSNHFRYQGKIDEIAIRNLSELIYQISENALKLENITASYQNMIRTPHGPVLSDRTDTIKINPQTKY